MTRRLVWTLGVAVGLLAAACAYPSRLEREADRAFRRQAWDEAVALYSRLVQQFPERLEFQTRYWWVRLRAAQAHLLRAHQAERAGDLERALVELETAADLDPTNAEIQQYLQDLRQRLKPAPSPAPTPIPTPQFTVSPETVLRQPITHMNFSAAPLPVVLKSLAQVLHLQLVIDPDVPSTPVTLQFTDTTLEQALAQLARNYGLFFRFLDAHTLVVAPDTPEKRQQYRDYWMYTFRIEYTRAANVLQILRQTLRLDYVATDPQQETITVVGARDQVEAAARLIAQVDVAPAEVLIHMDILEINRSLLQQYGLQVASPGVPGVESALQPEPKIQLDPGPILSRSDFALVNLPSLVARLLKQSAHARLLQSVPVRTVEGVPGRIRFGSEIPVPQTTFVPFATGGPATQPITSFIYRVIGLNIDLTPKVHENGDITIQVVVESSSVAGQGFGGAPVFSTSRIEKTIRLRPNETSLIAGLIREQMRDVVEGLPGLESIPILGNLLSRHSREREENEIIVLLTPYLVRPRPPVQYQAIEVPAPSGTAPMAPPSVFPLPPPPTPSGEREKPPR